MIKSRFVVLSCVSGTLMCDPVVMLSLYPEFPQTVMSSVVSCGEFVFLIDRSGSMDCCMDNRNQQETRIGSARVFIMCQLCHKIIHSVPLTQWPSLSFLSSSKDTLLLLLKSLPMGCYFNIYSFGSNYQHIFP